MEVEEASNETLEDSNAGGRRGDRRDNGRMAADQQRFDGVELKMLGIGDTSVTRVAPIVGEFEKLTGGEVHIDEFPYPGLIDKIVVEASRTSPLTNCSGSIAPGWECSGRPAPLKT